MLVVADALNVRFTPQARCVKNLQVNTGVEPCISKRYNKVGEIVNLCEYAHFYVTLTYVCLFVCFGAIMVGLGVALSCYTIAFPSIPLLRRFARSAGRWLPRVFSSTKIYFFDPLARCCQGASISPGSGLKGDSKRSWCGTMILRRVSLISDLIDTVNVLVLP